MKTEFRIVRKVTQTTKEKQMYFSMCLVTLDENGKVTEIGNANALIASSVPCLISEILLMQEALCKKVIDKETMCEI